MNVLELLRKHGIEPRQVSSSKGGEYHSPCPGCGGDDRFHVWQAQEDGDGSWWCRQCDKGGDGIQFLREFEAMSYRDACAALDKDPGVDTSFRRPFQQRPAVQRPAWSPTSYTAPAELWAAKAGKLVAHAHTYLTGEHGAPHMAWLADRGISPETVAKFRIGWNPGEKGMDIWRPRESWGLPTEIKENGKKKKLWIPRGLTIPHYIDDDLHRVRIRRWEETGPRYYVMPGSGMAPMLIGEGRRGYVVIETELDGMLVDQVAGDLVGVMAMGSSSAKPDARAHQSLAEALSILGALDFDKAGAQAWKWWPKHYRRAVRWPVPAGKDPGEAFQAGTNLRGWIMSGLPPSLTMGRCVSGLLNVGGADFDAGADVAEKESSPNPMDGAPAGVAELFGYLRQCPVKIKEGFTLLENKDWAGRNWEKSKRISELIFKDPDVRAHLEVHPDSVVGALNFWKGG